MITRLRTCLTNVRAQGASAIVKGGFSHHEIRRNSAKFRTVLQGADMVGFGVLLPFFKAVLDQLFAGLMAFDALFDTVLHFVGDIFFEKIFGKNGLFIFGFFDLSFHSLSSTKQDDKKNDGRLPLILY